MVDLDLRPGRRELVAARLVAELESAVAGATAGLRGSLASGSADGFSDIDVLWIVPDNILPVFWRVDLDVRASSVGRDDRYDDDNPAAHSDVGWSRPGSAIENATAAVKATVRHPYDPELG
jgi:hypothetical protein